MGFVLAITRHTGKDLAEVGFLLIVIAGVWLAAAQLPQPRWRVLRTVVAGIVLAAGGVLLIIATHCLEPLPARAEVDLAKRARIGRVAVR
jgi:hypothetical protein